MPDSPPVRIIRLRLYLDRAKLSEELGASDAASALVDALLEPQGSGELPPSAGSMRGAAAFHRTRLRLSSGRAPTTSNQFDSSDSPLLLWERCRTTVSAWQPALGDALLGELLASLRRRRRRGRDKPVGPALGPEASSLLRGSGPDLSALGVADPLVAPWSETPGIDDVLGERLESLSAAELDPPRGSFRETYRRALNAFRATYLPFALSAHERGLLEATGDAFFIPLDLVEALAGDEAPPWLPQAVSSNRAEYQSLVDVGGPPESIIDGDSARVVEDRDEWLLGPLWPLL